MQALGQRIAGFVTDCSRFLKNGMQNFDLYEQVTPDGSSGKLWVSPRNVSAICFASHLLTTKHCGTTSNPSTHW